MKYKKNVLKIHYLMPWKNALKNLKNVFNINKNTILNFKLIKNHITMKNLSYKKYLNTIKPSLVFSIIFCPSFYSKHYFQKINRYTIEIGIFVYTRVNNNFVIL